jgi:arginine/serine-rich splicing factor 16
MLVIFCRPSSFHILEALHIDPASGVSLDNDKSTKASKSAVR